MNGEDFMMLIFNGYSAFGAWDSPTAPFLKGGTYKLMVNRLMKKENEMPKLLHARAPWDSEERKIRQLAGSCHARNRLTDRGRDAF